METPAEKGFFERLRERRFFRFVLSYLVGGWGVLQFLDWFVDHYGLAGFWVDAYVVLFLTMIPSVLVLTYFHGKPGRQGWGRLEKVFLPVNLMIALGLVYVFFATDSGAVAANQVTVQDEMGKEIQRMVPTKQGTQNLIVFPFMGEKGAQWKEHIASILLVEDLNQDFRMYATSSLQLNSQYDKYGYTPDQELPLSIKLKIAENNFADVFMEGTLQEEGENIKGKVNIVQVSNGKTVLALEAEATDVTLLIDKLTTLYLDRVELPDLNAEGTEVIDLPSSNLLSSQEESMKEYVEGVLKVNFERNVEEGLECFQKATDADPNFAYAYLGQASALNRINRKTEAKEAMQKAIDLMNGLSERQQFKIRHRYYIQNEDYDRAIDLCEMWRKLYPMSIQPYSYLINMYAEIGEFEKAKEVAKQGVPYDNTGQMLIALSRIASLQGKTEEAEKYFEEFAEKYPERAELTDQRGALLIRGGKYQEALEHFEQMVLMDPNNYQAIARLGEVNFRMGAFAEAERQYEAALTAARTAQDSAQVEMWKYSYFAAVGKIDQSIASLEKRGELQRGFLTEYEVMAGAYMNFQNIRLFVDSGKKQEIEEKLNTFFEQFPDQTGFYTCAADINFAIAIEDADKISASMDRCRDLLGRVGGPTMMAMLEGFQNKVEGNYPKAIQAFRKYMEGVGGENAGIYFFEGQLRRLNGEYQEAIRVLEKVLVSEPQMAEAYLELAMSYEALGQRDQALSALDECLRIWRDADPTYVRAQEAHALKKEWTEGI
jgi:tetratricopeptide (TPR) repeat protein